MLRRAKIVAILGFLVLCSSAWAVEPNLVSHWKFDEGSGAIAVDSVGGNVGIIYGDAAWTAGQVDGALSFDGDWDYVDCGNTFASVTGSTTKTITAWAKSDTADYSGQAAGNGRIITLYRESGYSGFSMLAKGSPATWQGLYAIAGNLYNHIDSGLSVTANEWTHIALVQDGAGVYIYINGVLANSSTDGAAPTMRRLVNADIGAYDGEHGNINLFFEGAVDELMIFDRALSAEEIQQLYQNGVGELIGLEITGPEEVAENFEAQYKTIAHYDNNSTKDVTDSADWQVEPNSIASIEGGLLTTEEIYILEEDITIYAQYMEDTNTVEAEKEVSVFAVCPRGSALQFDGVNDYADCGNGASINNLTRFSVSLWFKADVIPSSSGDYFISQRDLSSVVWAFILHGDFSGRVAGAVIADGSNAISTTDFIPNIGEWYHGAMTYDDLGDRKIRIYINGTEQSYFHRQPASGTMASNPSVHVAIGNRIGGGRDFGGSVDEVSIYNRALSPEEIQANMHILLSGDEPNLIAYWDFDEGEGQITYDLSGNGNDGQLGSTPNPDNSDPAWAESDAPVGICTPVEVDIKPGSCPNPLNVASKGVLPVAILGSDTFDVTTIDAASIFLDGVPAIRSSLEDVAAPASDGNECDCNSPGPDGYSDLTLKFRTHQVVEELIDWPGELAQGETLLLTLTGELSDGTAIEGTDCVVLVGNVPRWLSAKKWDGNEDGVVNLFDLAEMAQYWLESSVVTD